MELQTVDFSKLPLEVLSETANDAARRAEKQARSSLAAAHYAGRALLAAKERVERGGWQDWLAENWQHSERYAQMLMKIARTELPSESQPTVSIREAIRALAEPSDPKPKRVSVLDEAEETEPEGTEPAAAVTVQESPIAQQAPTAPRIDDRQPATTITLGQDEDRAAANVVGRIAQQATPLPQVASTEPPVLFQSSAAGQVQAVLLAVRDMLVSFESRADLEAIGKGLIELGYELHPDAARQARLARCDDPTDEQLREHIPADWSDELQEAAAAWASIKQMKPKAERIHSVTAWQRSLKRMASHPEHMVIEAIDKAISNNWQGWEHFEHAKNGTKPTTAVRQRNWEAEYELVE